MDPSTPFDSVPRRAGTDTYKWDYRPHNSRGRDVLPMWVADMDFACPDPVIDALRRRVDHAVFGYTFASDAYRESFVSWQRRRHAWTVDPATLVFAPGVMPAVRSAILGLTDPGDQVVIQPPVYYPFFDAIVDNGRTLVENPLVQVGGRYQMDLDHLESVISPRTRMIVLCSPHNPVGRVWTRAELERFADIAVRHDLIVVSDEIHADIRRAGVEFTPMLDVGHDIALRTVACHAPSKTFNIAGLPSAHVVIPDPQLRSRFERTLGRLGFGLASPLALVASRAAYDECESWVDRLSGFLDAQLDRLVSEAAALGIPVARPEGTYLGWLDFRPIQKATAADDEAVRRALLEEGGLWLSEGRQFGSQGSGFQRINIATSRALFDDAIGRLGQAVAALTGTRDAGASR